eukprot:Skav217406  [mRNA]  locus=scaffold2674:101349:102426:- [translate_table: standard]
MRQTIGTVSALLWLKPASSASSPGNGGLKKPHVADPMLMAQPENYSCERRRGTRPSNDFTMTSITQLEMISQSLFMIQLPPHSYLCPVAKISGPTDSAKWFQDRSQGKDAEVSAAKPAMYG